MCINVALVMHARHEYDVSVRSGVLLMPAARQLTARALRGWRNTVGNLTEFVWLKKTYHGPQITGICVKNRGVRFHRILFQHYWILCRGGCSGRGVRWMGVVLYSKIVHNIIQITTPCFHCTPLCRM